MAVYDSFIKRSITIALDEFMKRDMYLLQNNLNERAITHKLAEYLQDEFGSFYSVDCEYNRNFLTPGSSKKIHVVYEKLADLVNDKTKIEILNGQEYRELSVFPDIIVHKRGGNKNLLVIEVKKSNSRIDQRYDFIKLESYTDNSENNNLHYDYGVFICFDVENYLFPSPIWFKNGKQLKDI